jgi:hypothetical protein
MAKAIKTALIAAAVTFVAIYTGGVLFGTPAAIFGTGTGTAVIAFQYAVVTAVGTLVSAGIGMLTSRGIEATRGNFGTKLTGRSAQAPRQIIYGKTRVGGTIAKMTTSGTENTTLHLAVVIAGHEIQSLEKVYINDIELTTTSATTSGETVFTVTNSEFTNTENENNFGSGRLIRFTFHNGSQTAVDGLAQASLTSAQYPNTAKFQGMAYVYMELVYDPEKNGQMPALWFEVKGKKVFDPRDSSTAWSDNPALIIRDFITDSVYGLKATTGEINDGANNVVGSFYEAAEICDETVSVPTDNATTYAVTVVSTGSGNKYAIDGTQQPTLALKEGNTYTFDQSDGTNSNHPLRFSTTSDGTHGGGSQYTTGVTTNGTAGSSGAYTRITVAVGAPTLYYYCTNHSGMGGSATTASGTTEKRYTANGFTNASAQGEGVLEGLLSACAGSISYTNGKFNLFVGGDQTPALTITDDDVLGDIAVSTKSSGGELYNTVKSIFVSANDKYEAMESPVYANATYLAQDTPSGESSANYKNILELQFPFTLSQTMAQRLGAIVLDRQRQTTTVSLLTTVEYMRLQPNDWVYVTNERMSFSSKVFEVQSTNLEFAESDGQLFAATRLVLREIDTTVYDYAASDYVDFAADGTAPSGGSLAISAPTNLTLTQITAQEGTTAKIDVQVSWTNAQNDAIQGTEISYRLSTDGATAYKTAGFAGRGETSVTFPGAVVGKQYYVRIRHFAFDNVVSAYTSPANITIAEPDTISAPTSVSATTGKIGFTDIAFTAPAVESVTKVNIHFSTSSGFTPASSNLLTTVAVTNGAVVKHPVGLVNGLSYDTTYYFKLTAENSYGTVSSASTEVSGSFTKAAAADIVDGSIDVAKFASGIEPVSLVTSVPGSKSTETIYNTSNNVLYRWNGSSYVTVQGATNFNELAGTITSTQITDDAVTAPKIASNAVTAAKIAAGTITANEISSNTITAGQIATGAIGADEIAANSLSIGKIVSGTSKEYSTNSDSGANFKFEFGTSTSVAGYQGAGILRTGISAGFGVAGLANASNSIAVAGQQANNASDAYGSYFANSTALGGLTHRSQAGFCNNTRAAVFADNASTTNFAYVCNGTYAVQTTGDLYVDGDITATGTITPFTGMHDGLMADTDTPSIGDILIDSSVIAKRTISNTLFVMVSSSSTNQPAIGIYAGDRGSSYIPVAIADHTEVSSIDDSGAPTVDSAYSSALVDRKCVIVNSLGEGQVNVCGEGGNITAGDLIVTSSTAGKGMKQADDIVRGYTVAKARESITFEDASDTGQIACIYLCG